MAQGGLGNPCFKLIIILLIVGGFSYFSNLFIDWIRLQDISLSLTIVAVVVYAVLMIGSVCFCIGRAFGVEGYDNTRARYLAEAILLQSGIRAKWLTALEVRWVLETHQDCLVAEQTQRELHNSTQTGQGKAAIRRL